MLFFCQAKDGIRDLVRSRGLGDVYKRQGLNKHCKYLLLEFAFEKMEVCRVEFRADLRNKRSIAAMKSIGCKLSLIHI